jgi:hypothetical protein
MIARDILADVIRHGIRAMLSLAVLLTGVATSVRPMWSQPGAECALEAANGLRVCALTGDSVEGRLASPSLTDVYGLEVAAFEPRIAIELTATASLRVRLTDATGIVLGETPTTIAGTPVRLDVAPRQPGVYYALIDASDPPSAGDDLGYRLAVQKSEPSGGWQIVSSSLRRPVAEVAAAPPSFPPWEIGITTPRGGTPATGVANARALNTAARNDIGDFLLSAVVSLDGTEGPAAATIRFHFEPEAGGGSGYLFALDPRQWLVRLSTFEEGRQIVLVPWSPISVAKSGDRVNVTLAVTGPNIVAHVNGEQTLVTQHDKFSRGRIVLGAVTWSEPVRATFGHVLVAAPPTVTR